MIDRGKVFKTEGSSAWVEFPRSSVCEKCGACSLAASGQMTVEADNRLGAKVGDRVEVEISQLLNFLLPLLFLAAGLALGGFISQPAGVIFGIIFLAAGFLLRRKKFKAKIVKIFNG